MQVAFIILAYKNPVQLRILVQHLIHPNHYFFIHIDKNVDIDPFKAELGNYTGNVIWVKRETSYWGSFQCVKALLNGLKQAYEFNWIQFDYFIHLSGQDFPLKSPEFIQKTLGQNAPINFINLIPYPIPSWQNGGMDRLKHFKFFWKNDRIIIHPGMKNIFLRLSYKILSILFEAIDKRKRFYGGEFYFMLHRSGISRLFNNINKYPVFFNRLKFVTLPEEILIPTILMAENENIGEIFRDDVFRFINWESIQRGPKEMEEKEISKYLGSPYLFGRKFKISSRTFKIEFDE